MIFIIPVIQLSRSLFWNKHIPQSIPRSHFFRQIKKFLSLGGIDIVSLSVRGKIKRLMNAAALKKSVNIKDDINCFHLLNTAH